MNLKKHYQELYKLHNDSPKSLQWSDRETQIARFKILREVDVTMSSIIDLGCGLAHLYDYLKTNGFDGKYHGLDFVPEFVKACKSKHENDSKSKFQEFDIARDQFPSGYDYILLSGVFNNEMTNNKEFMLNAIKKMFNACEKGIAFNSLSTYVDFKSEGLYYSNPLEVFDFCKNNLTRKVTLRHDYLVKENSIPFEYTIYLYK